MMKILLIYPPFPATFWSFKYALKLISKKAVLPPLGLLTVAAMLPKEWEKRLIDMNVTVLNDADIRWSDYVFISAMDVQRNAAKEVISRCNSLGVKTVAGGPLFTAEYDDYDSVDHLVLGEAETTLPLFLSDLAKGCAGRVYNSEKRPDMKSTPIPLWSLINTKDYLSMSVQCSRGCPFDCEFCDVVFLNGHKPRTKSSQQISGELEALYECGWRGPVFIVDDNFIGNKKKLKAEILPAMIEWSKRRKFPGNFYTQVSIDLSDDEELMQLMTECGFNRVFIGIESTNEESLTECNKLQNKSRDLAASVKKIHNYGLEVQGSFIIGFDSDPNSIFDSLIEFIQKNGIVTAMVCLLIASRGTRLYKRLQIENRLLYNSSGDMTDCFINFVPKMKYDTLIDGYKHILNTIYSPKNYYERVLTFYNEYQPQTQRKYRGTPFNIKQLVMIKWFTKSIWFLGVVDNGRKYFWKLLFSTLLYHPHLLLLSIRFSVYGLHFFRHTRKIQETRAIFDT